MFTDFMHSSRKFQTFLCERAAIGANRKSSSGSRNLKNLAKKNKDILGDYIENAIKTLSSIYLMDKPASIVLEIACIKGLFMWFLDNADELENEEASDEYQLAKKVTSILNQDYKKISDKLSSEITKVEDEMLEGLNRELGNANLNGMISSANESYGQWYGYIDDMCLVVMWAWGKNRFIPNISNNITSFSYRFLLYLVDKLYCFTWSSNKEQLNEYKEYIQRRIQLGMQSPRDSLLQCTLEKQIDGFALNWDYNSLVRICDAQSGTEKDFIIPSDFYEYWDDDDDYDEDDEDEIQDDDDSFGFEHPNLRISLRMCLEGLFANQDGIFVGDLLKVGISPKEVMAISNAFASGMSPFKKFLNVSQRTYTNDELINLERNQVVSQYIQQTCWELKIIYRMVMFAIINMRQLVLQQYYLKEQGKNTPTKAVQKKSGKEKSKISELQAKIQLLEKENKQLYDKNASLMRKNNRLLSELESGKSENPDSFENELEEDTDVEPDDCAPEESSCCEYEALEEELDWIAEVNAFAETHSVVIVGGDENLLKNIAKEMPKISLINGNKNTPSDGLVSHADIVFFRYSALPHDMFNRVRKTCSSYNVPYEYLTDSTAIHLLAKDIYQKIQKRFPTE